MAWTGDIFRRVVGFTPSTGGSQMLFECGHEQWLAMTPQQAVRVVPRDFPCDECSREPRERCRQVRDSIKFDDVIEKLEFLRDQEL